MGCSLLGSPLAIRVPVQSITRCLTVLRIINAQGSLTTMQVARLADLPYTTAKRIMATLMHEGFVEVETGRKRYRVTAQVQALAHGFQEHSQLIAVARPKLVQLTTRHRWPVLVATRAGLQMMVRDCTHPLTPMSLTNYYPGFMFPMLDSAAGRAYLAFAPEEERRLCLENIFASAGWSEPIESRIEGMEHDWRQIRAKGYAAVARNTFTEPPGRTSAIAAPLFSHDALVGTIAMPFFASTMSVDEGAKRFGEDLMRAAREIGVSMSAPARPSST